jgi:hypothetical protein
MLDKVSWLAYHSIMQKQNFKVIMTRHVSGGAVRGPRIVARASGGSRVIFDYNQALSFEERHKAAAQALCKKMGWQETVGPMIHAYYDEQHVFLLPY